MARFTNSFRRSFSGLPSLRRGGWSWRASWHNAQSGRVRSRKRNLRCGWRTTTWAFAAPLTQRWRAPMPPSASKKRPACIRNGLSRRASNSRGVHLDKTCMLESIKIQSGQEAFFAGTCSAGRNPGLHHDLKAVGPPALILGPTTMVREPRPPAFPRLRGFHQGRKFRCCVARSCGDTCPCGYFCWDQ